MAGVSAGTGAMSSLLGKLTALLSDEYTLLTRVRKEVEFLRDELGTMQALQTTLADMHDLEPHEKVWKGNLREISYDIEDCIDRFMARLGSGDAKPRFMKRTMRRLKSLWKRHEIAKEIQDLKARVVQESQRRERYKLDNLTIKSRFVEIDPRLPALFEESKGLVAIDGPMNKIVGWLVEEKAELKVVAIIGGGGLGKTTLAMEVYRKIKGHFQYGVSVSVSRSLDLDKLFKDVLFQIDKNKFGKCQEERWEKEQLIREITQTLTGKRYLIVIDDVWREQDWKFVKTAFPENHNGSRIIATTRITNVAKACCSISGDQLYQMAGLNDVDSRRLFYKRIFCSENTCPPQLETVSARILKKCGGLPLAIITIASFLANKPQTKDEWERLQESIGSDSSHENDDSFKVMRDILLLSYWDLPQRLKTCLLYLCIYPEDDIINCEELKRKWIAEGFIDTQWGNLDREADTCLNELVNRSMIQPVDADYDSSIQYCQVHDIVLDLIISLSDEENFATVLNGRPCNYLRNKIRRLSVHSSGPEHKVAFTNIISHARSLNVFGEFEQIPPLVDFCSLRVLDLREGSVNGSFCWLGNKQIQSIGSISQLRYLRLDSTRITELPEDIGKLQYLETLDLRKCGVTTLPSTMVKLSKLLRLFVHEETLVLPADVFGSMETLEEVSSISYVDNPMKFAEELGHLIKLKKLYMPCSVALLSAKNGDYLERFLDVLGSSLNELGKYNLRCLNIAGTIGEYLFRDPCCTFPHLQDLEILTLIERVPKGIMASLNNIVKLVIRVRLFDEEDLHLLMGMPSLVHLQLTLYHQNGIGKMLTIGCNGFNLLKVFHYESVLSPGTGIAFAPGALRALRRLHLCCWIARDTMSGDCDGANLGIEHLSGLAHLLVETNCRCASPGYPCEILDEVEAVEASVEKAIALHPNRHALQVNVRRATAHHTYKDDKDPSKKKYKDAKQRSMDSLKRQDEISFEITGRVKERNVDSCNKMKERNVDSDEEYWNSETDMGESPPPTSCRLLQEDPEMWRDIGLPNSAIQRVCILPAE